MLLPEIAKNILSTLIKEEKGGKPLTLNQALERWGNGSAWEDLVDCGYVSRTTGAVTVSDQGRKWLKEHK